MTAGTIGHGARLTIDLGAIQRNWRHLGTRGAGAEAAGVVKADAYGCGIAEVVPALAKAGCRTFFVAHLSEAVRARTAAPEATIYVLNGLPTGTLPTYRSLDLRPVLGSLPEIAEWLATPEAPPAALHVDTGMNRLGLSLDEVAEIPAVFRPALLLTHFVSSEIPADPINALQIERFRALMAHFPQTPASLANSAGLFLDGLPPQALVRPGYSLYGGNPTPAAANPMEPVVRLEANIIGCRRIRAGETVGYNGQWTAPGERVIATISLGYADGFLRAASGTDAAPAGSAIVNGMRCPLAGRVSMDLVTLDVTDVPDVGRGSVATLIGDELDIDTVAASMKTNGYEVLTRLAARLDRHYVMS